MLNFFNLIVDNDDMENLKILRKKTNLTQKEVADAVGITFQTYSYYETGRTNPTPEMLCKLADFFGVTVDELLGRTAQLFDDARVPKTEVQELFDRLNVAEQERALGYMERMLEERGIVVKRRRA